VKLFIKSLALVTILFLIMAGCYSQPQKPLQPYLLEEPVIQKGAAGHGEAEHKYQIQVLIISDSDGMNSRSIFQHMDQSLHSGVALDVKAVEELKSINLSKYDFVYLDTNLATANEFASVPEHLIQFVEKGGTLFLSNEYAAYFPKDFLGIQSLNKIDTKAMDFVYPEVRGNLKGLQAIWKSFAEDYSHYEKKNAGMPKLQIDYEQAAVADTATVLVEQDNLAYLLANQAGEGMVIWSNTFMPNEKYITAFDLKGKEEQKYFHFGYAAANYFFRNELINLVSKEKYGFSVRKGYGPYGRPGIAWQNHYEALYSVYIEDMIKWTEILEEYNQIPSFSLIRDMYNGGQWHSNITLHINEGTNEKPVFKGELENSFFSSGEKIQLEDDYLKFTRYPGYTGLLSKIKLPQRAYPQVIDWNNDGKKDIIAGTWEGEIYFIKNVGADNSPQFKEKIKLTAEGKEIFVEEGGAAPFVYDYNHDGLVDLLVGDRSGRIRLFLNQGDVKDAKLIDSGFIKSEDEDLKVHGDAAPIMVDWDGDDISDLLVGESTGQIVFFKGSQIDGKLSFHEGSHLQAMDAMVKVNAFAVPLAVDWNENGRLDLLVGAGDGRIYLYHRNEQQLLEKKGPIEGLTYNFFGEKSLYAGHNAAPLIVDWNNDGKKDLLIGQIDYGIPYAIDSEIFPYKEKLQKAVEYVLKKHIPIIPHMHFHEYKSDEQEKREIELHKKAFQAIGIPWEKDMGVNHHTWRISKDALRTFANQRESGIWWNFGFQPPNLTTSPRDGIEYLWVLPFMLPDSEPSKPFILHAPAPHVLNYPKAWDSLGKLDIPLTYFEHIEQTLHKKSTAYERNFKAINFLNGFKDKYEYNFMTEEQMARSLLNTFLAEVDVTINKDRLVLKPNYSLVPDKVKEYKNTSGVKIELGERLQGKELDTSSMFYYKVNNGHYIGINKEVEVSFVDKSALMNKIHIVRSNGPVEITINKKTLKLDLKAKGLQEVKLYSPEPLVINGTDIEVVNDGKYYTVTRFGDLTAIEVFLQ
jgi:hypothetical protein